jgi:hypothetical protein
MLHLLDWYFKLITGIKLSPANSTTRRSPDKFTKLKCPITMPDDWINMLELSKEQVTLIRGNERKMCEYVTYLNEDDTYVSPAVTIANTPTKKRKWLQKTRGENKEAKLKIKSAWFKFKKLKKQSSEF